MVLINETPKQQGDMYVTAYENTASLGAVEYVFPELQSTLTIFNFGLRNIVAVANGQRKIVEPNDSENFKHVNSVFLEALQGSQRFRLEGRKGVEQIVAGTVDSVARESAQDAVQKVLNVEQNLKDFAYLAPVRTASNVADVIQNLYNIVPDYSTLKVPSGEYTIDKPLVFNRNVNLNFAGVTLKYTGPSNGAAVTLGKNDAYLTNIDVIGLYVVRVNPQRTDPNEIGIRMVNLRYSRVEFSSLYFYNLVYVDAIDRGNVYNDYRPIWLYSGVNSLVITSNAAGWSNENNYFGGSFAMDSLVSSADKVHVKVLHNGYRQNNNRFFGCSFEDGGAKMYAIDCDGGSHYFYGCRFEGSKKVKFGTNSIDNKIWQGFGTETIVLEDLGANNDIITNRKWKLTVGQDGFEMKNNFSSTSKTFKLLNTAGVETFGVTGAGAVNSSSFGSFALGIRFSTDRGLYVGTGSPEGVVSASAGSLYVNTSGGSGASVFVKESGAGNVTGWRAYASSVALTSIASTPSFLGQTAVVGGVGYMATGTASAADWKQITN